jgi:hypothetical protein
MGRHGSDKGSWDEDGRKIAPTWPKGGAGSRPKGKAKDKPAGGFGLSIFKRGPTRGHSSTGNPRKGFWW